MLYVLSNNKSPHNFNFDFILPHDNFFDDSYDYSTPMEFLLRTPEEEWRQASNHGRIATAKNVPGEK